MIVSEVPPSALNRSLVDSGHSARQGIFCRRIVFIHCALVQLVQDSSERILINSQRFVVPIVAACSDFLKAGQ